MKVQRSKSLAAPIKDELEVLRTRSTALAEADAATTTGKKSETAELKKLQTEMDALDAKLTRVLTTLGLDGANEHSMQYFFTDTGEFSKAAKEWQVLKRRLIKFSNALSLLLQPLDQMGLGTRGIKGVNDFSGLHKYFAFPSF